MQLVLSLAQLEKITLRLVEIKYTTKCIKLLTLELATTILPKVYIAYNITIANPYLTRAYVH